MNVDLFQALLDNSPDYIFFKDRESRFVKTNKAHAQLLLGLEDPEEAVGKTDFDLFPGQEEDAQRFYEEEQEIMRSGEGVIRREWQVPSTTTGEIVWLAEHKLPLKDETGQIVGLIGIGRDVTERKRAEEEVKIYAARLELSNRELESFAYIASHDLQEPLRKVIAFGDRLKLKYADQLGERGIDYLERMQNASDRMQNLIDVLLTYSRVTTKAQSFVPVDLNQVMDDVVSDLEMRIKQVGGRVEVADLPTIRADPTQMRQLLQNLVANALKFHKPNEPPIVKLQAQLLDGYNRESGDPASATTCRLTVQDNGIGFDEKYSDRIFQVFQRLHGRGEYEGTGVGLAICRKIVERHGGQIAAHGTPDEGATFVVTLPIEQTVEGE